MRIFLLRTSGAAFREIFGEVLHDRSYKRYMQGEVLRPATVNGELDGELDGS